MVGGRIVEIVRYPQEPTVLWVNCAEIEYPKNECAIKVDPGGRDIRVGDACWWQGRWAYWTPYLIGTYRLDPSRGREDTPIKRVGYSGVNRPTGGGEGT